MIDPKIKQGEENGIELEKERIKDMLESKILDLEAMRQTADEREIRAIDFCIMQLALIDHEIENP